MRNRRFIPLCLVATLFGGCASLPRDAGFGDVQRLVAERSGESPQWAGVSIEEQALENHVRELLAEEMSVATAVRLALLNNPSLRAELEGLGIARADLARAGLPRNPVLGAALRFPDGGGGTGLEFSIVQEFLDVVRLPLRRRVAAQHFEQVKLRTADAALSLAANTRDAFFKAQGSRWLLEIHTLIEEVAETAADAAERLRRAGNITDLALAKEQAGYQRARLERMRAEADKILADEELGKLLGLPPTTSPRLAPRLPDPPPVEIAETGLQERALAQRLDLAAARLERNLLAESLRGTRLAATQPDLGVGVATERETDGSWLTGPMASVNLPLFDGGKAAVDGDRGRLRQAIQREIALEKQVRGEVRQAFVQMAAARAEVEHYRRVLAPLHERIVDESLSQYNAMQLGLFPLLQAKLDQLRVGAELVQCRRDYWQAHGQLSRAVGGALPAPPIEDELEALFETEPAPDIPPSTAPQPHQDHAH